jgi:hypothetical protein
MSCLFDRLLCLEVVVCSGAVFLLLLSLFAAAQVLFLVCLFPPSLCGEQVVRHGYSFDDISLVCL